MSAHSALPGLFLRPYAAQHTRSTAARVLAAACSQPARTSYLLFYQATCSLQHNAAAGRRYRHTFVHSSQPSRRSYSSKKKPSSCADQADESADASREDRSPTALRIKELTDAGALRYPRYEPAVVAGNRLSVSQFRTEFESVPVPSGGEDDGDARNQRRRLELAGRVLSVRRMGSKLAFLQIVDNGEHVQVMCNLRRLQDGTSVSEPQAGAMTPALFKSTMRLLNRGDHVAVTGQAVRTITGELTLDSDTLPRVYSPALAPLPARLYDGDTRALRRHIDLLVNPGQAATLRLRARILRDMRTFFEDQNFVEVQTPILADLAGGAVARPFLTTYNSYIGDEADSGRHALSLRIAPELWLKRLVVGGLDRVFEIGPSFRNEGIDGTHNPEFTTCEFYAAYWTLPQLIAETERLLTQLARTAIKFRRTPTGAGLAEEPRNQSLNLCAAGGPYLQLEFIPSLEEALGVTFPDLSAPDAYERVRDLLVAHGHTSRDILGAPGHAGDSGDVADADGGRLSKLLDRLASVYLEPRSYSSTDGSSEIRGGPLFITHHPACMSPLAKSFVCPRTGQTVAARAELFVDGRELANMYEEENDPAAQRRKMEQQSADTGAGIDENYIAALESGLPPTGGWGCGVERLVMLCAGAPRIADCLSFKTLQHVMSMKK